MPFSDKLGGVLLRGAENRTCKEQSDSVARCNRASLARKAGLYSKQTPFVFASFHLFPRFPQNQDFADFLTLYNRHRRNQKIYFYKVGLTYTLPKV